MRVLALTRYGPLGASSRTRTYQYLPGLRADGIDVRVLPLLRDTYLHRLYAHQVTNWKWVVSDYLLRASQLFRAGRYDLLWIEKELFPNIPGVVERLLKACGIRYVVDYDDAIFHNYDLSHSAAKRFLSRKIDRVMRNAEVVICGNRYLADRARFAGARQVEIIPTVVDLDRYCPRSQVEYRRHSVIGWIGMPATVRYLELVVPALKVISAERSVQVRVIGAEFSSPGVNIECRPWREKTEVAEIQDFDVGIMPLADSPWERGKCGYKLIQYMACGKPVIASAVGMNREIVVPGVNGYLADNTAEWVAALRTLLCDPDLCRRLGVEGRSAVEQNYSLEVTTPRLARLFHQLSPRESA